MKTLVRLMWEALFLSELPYSELRAGPSPALRGLGIVVLVAVAVALVGLVGTTLEWATTPNMSDIRRVVLEGIQKMPWYQEVESDAEFREQFSQFYDLGWRIFPSLFGAPNVAEATARIIILPLGLALVWFLYGLLAHLFARLLGGQGGLGQTLGCTALAVAPQLLNLATFFPYVVVGGAIGAWTLLGRYVAVKTSHRLTVGRALAATLLPYVIFALAMASVSFLAGIAMAWFVSQGGMSQ